MNILTKIILCAIAFACLYSLLITGFVARLYHLLGWRLLGWRCEFSEKSLPNFDLGKDDEIVI